jgi:protein O-GlcNAc transferase
VVIDSDAALIRLGEDEHMKPNYKSGFRPGKQSSARQPKNSASREVDRLLRDALAHHRAGQLAQAETLYRQVLQLSPDNRDALHLLGLMAHQTGKHAIALELIDKAILLRPDYAEAYSLRGNTLEQLGQYELAVESFDQAIRLKPDFAEAYNNRGNALQGLRQYQTALKNFDRALQLNPDFAEAHNNRGNALQVLQQPQVALESFDKAIQLKPGFAQAHNNRGNALHELHQYQAAMESFDNATRLLPGLAEAHNSRGNALRYLHQYQPALKSFNQAIALKPDFAEAYNNRGNALRELQQHQAALQSFDRAIQHKPDFAEAHSNRGSALRALQQDQAAVESFERAIQLNPGLAEAYNNRGNALHALQQYQAALDSFDKAIQLNPALAEGYTNRGNTLHAQQQHQAALQSVNYAILLKPTYEYLAGAQLHLKQFLCEWEGIDVCLQRLEASIDRHERVADPFIFLTVSNSPALQKKAAEIYVRDKYLPSSIVALAPNRHRRQRMRIGYFSADYHNHPTSFLMAELFERHDRSRFEILGFSFGPDIKDAMNQRVSAAMDRFLDVRSMSDEGVGQLTRELDVDIAVDLKGFTEHSRMGIFAHRAAPIQVSYLGFPATTGAPYMDYLIADHTLIPQASRQHYSEKIAYLPGSYQANDSRRLISPTLCTRINEGLPEQGFVYCCFNNNYKITPQVFGIWMRILAQVEGSVLWLLEDNPWAAESLRKEAVRRGISQQRLIFAKRLPLVEHLARHRLADLFLDTFPCNAHTTASDALWAGLPVLTRTGETFASRVAASLLRAIDLPELVTTTEKTYEKLALELAFDAERCQKVRKRLQRNRTTSPLFDLPSFTKHLEAAYSAMYERYQAALPPDHVDIVRNPEFMG